HGAPDARRCAQPVHLQTRDHVHCRGWRREEVAAASGVRPTGKPSTEFDVFKFPQSRQLIPAMSEIAREAGALLMEYFHQHLKIEYKGEADLVTAADRAAEAMIRDRIRQRWPSH